MYWYQMPRLPCRLHLAYVNYGTWRPWLPSKNWIEMMPWFPPYAIVPFPILLSKF